jgi:hypothetical protein
MSLNGLLFASSIDLAEDIVGIVPLSFLSSLEKSFTLTIHDLYAQGITLIQQSLGPDDYCLSTMNRRYEESLACDWSKDRVTLVIPESR